MARKTHEQFVSEVEEKYGKDSYTFLTKYNTTANTILAMHNLCGYKWNVYPNNLLNGLSKCPNCSNKKTYTTEEFAQIVNEITNGEYELTGEYKQAFVVTTIKHLQCGDELQVCPHDFKTLNIRCSKCESVFSSGEAEIANYLASINLNYRVHYHIEECKDKKALPFDFAIFDSNGDLIYLIEYDGQQHFEPVDFAGRGKEWAIDQFEQMQKRDRIKDQYCKDNNIPLIRIPYWKKNEIDSILNNLI